MPNTKNATRDEARKQVEEALAAYARRHAGADVKVKRQNPVALRIRVVDPAFRGLDWLKREDLVWKDLDKLPEEARSQITLVLLLAPEEVEGSPLNQEFERPARSRLTPDNMSRVRVKS
jgi:hypothetical protein